VSFWKRTFVPASGADRLSRHGDYAATRERFHRRPHSNLRFLVRERYAWMQPYLAGRQRVVELGAGPGLSRDVLDAPGLEITDVLDNPWLDRRVDAMDLPYAPGSLDAVICSHMIHHVASPVALISGIGRALKPGGLLLVNESTASLCHRFVMWAMRHEGWSYDVDVFDDAARAKESFDPLAGNNAVADLLFADHARFEAAFPGLTVTRDEFTEIFLFLLSGGVGGQVFTVELPEWGLLAVRGLDRVLTSALPGVFAFTRRLVLVKSG
jgi:SAM-dependent methyltransferase